MKKSLALIMCLALVMCAFIVGCDKKAPDTNEPETENGNESVIEEATLKFGLGVYTSTPVVTDATEDKEGTGKLDVTVAAITVDADGKIVSCDLDTASNTVKYTFDGKAVANTEFKTKYEFGADYNMVAYGGAAKEWFEQADAFEAFVAGKNLDEIKALVVEGNKGNEDVVNAGCTIMINEFVGAIEKAFNNAVESNATAENAVKVSVVTTQTCADAIEDKDGSNKLSTTVFAAAVDAEGKVVAAGSDCVEITFTFDIAGIATLDTTKAIVTKRDAGANYGMVAYGGAAKEWFEQADAFNATCIGKTAAEIAGFVGEDGRGTADIQSAGCTIFVTDLVKAATKI